MSSTETEKLDLVAIWKKTAKSRCFLKALTYGISAGVFAMLGVFAWTGRPAPSVRWGACAYLGVSLAMYGRCEYCKYQVQRVCQEVKEDMRKRTAASTSEEKQVTVDA